MSRVQHWRRGQPTNPGAAVLDLEAVRSDFPILKQRVYGKPLVYLDNAASSQKPQVVIDAISQYYETTHANVHRGVHRLSQEATEAYEGARHVVRDFINAAESREIVFVRGTTEAINLIAHSYGCARVKPGDEILISTMEHHSNIVPWQLLCEARGASLQVAPIDDRGVLKLDEFRRLLGPRTRLVAITHVSNSLGTINPMHEIIALAHEQNVPVLVDGAQAVPHMPVDVQELDCDFYCFSSHKVFGPTGVGVLYGKAEWLDALPPYQGGGDMISSVSFEKTTFNVLPYKFEAGTPNIAGVIGLGAALEYLRRIDPDLIQAHEKRLLEHATESLNSIEGLRLIGTAPQKASVLSFVMEGIHPHDIGTIVDAEGIAVRTGHHCAQPVMHRFGVPATARASLAFYNTLEEIEALAAALQQVRKVFG